MGYSTGEKSIEPMLPYLDDMLEAEPGDGCTWPCDEYNLRNTAHKIRQAMFAVQYYEKYTRYHDLRDQYQIREHVGWIEARWKKKVPKKRARELVMTRYSSLSEIVGATIENMHATKEIHFESADLSDLELEKLYQWGQQQDPAWHVINHETLGISITCRGDVDPIFYWKPEGEEKDE